MIPIGRPQHLGRKTMILMLIQGLIPCVLFLFIVIALSFIKNRISFGDSSSLDILYQFMPAVDPNYSVLSNIVIPVLFFLAIILGGIGILVNYLRYICFKFTLEEFGLRMRKGVLKVEEISIPYRQMQNVDVTRPLFYRILGLSRLVILSAGHEQIEEGDQTDTVFDPIDSEIAEEIRTLLGRRIGVQVIEHETEADKQDAEAKAARADDL